MRLVLLSILLAGCTSNEHAIYGTYLTNFDGVTINEYGGTSGGSVVEVTATDQWGGMLDDAYFHSESVDGTFSVQVPDGSVAVHLKFTQFTATDGNPTIYAIADGPITDDVDAGTITITTSY